MSLETWFAFVAASMLLTITPGPSILLGVVHSMQYGVKKTLFTALGDISANFLQMLLVAIGLGVIIASSELAFTVIKWFGVIVLLYMGIKMLFASAKPIQTQQTLTKDAHPTRLYLSGFLVAAGNPKAIVFFSAFFPQFIDPTQSLFSQMLIMCPTMAILDFSWVMFYALSANRCLGFMQQCPHFFNRIGGGALVGASALLALSTRASTN